MTQANDLAGKGVVHLTNVRLSFPHIAAPQPRKPGDSPNKEPSYSAAFLMTPDHPGFARFMEVVQQMATEKWGAKAGGVLQIVWQDNKKRCMGQGNEKINKLTLKPYDGYEGMLYITAGRKTQPQLIDLQGNGIDPTNTMVCQTVARGLYPGCMVNAAIKPWMQENEHGFGVRCDLIAVQFHKDNTPFGEAINDASAMFGATEAVAAPAGGSPPWMAQAVPAAAPAWGAPQMPAGAGMPPPPFAAPAAPAVNPPWMK